MTDAPSLKTITIALAGNPNAGKTSLFNQLTGAHAHVGNYPGVTVEKKEGEFNYGGYRIHVVDLPGTYSLTAYSLEELVAREFIIDQRPDLVVDVVDASNLDRNLYLGVQFMEMGVPVVIALNMVDVAEERGLSIDIGKLETLLGVRIAPTVARSRKGLDDLMERIVETARESEAWRPRPIRYGPDLDQKIKEISKLIEQGDYDTQGLPLNWLAIKILEGDAHVRNLLQLEGARATRIQGLVEEVTRHLKTTLEDIPEGVIADHRYGFIASVTKQAVTLDRDIRRNITDQVDLVVLNRIMAPIILVGVLYLVYQLTFWVGTPLVDALGAVFAWVGQTVDTHLSDGLLKSLLVSGVIDGVGGVVGFVPLIALMFFAISVLEDSGYMARIAFIMDRVLRTFGLHGSSVLALMIGGGISGGCAVPGVMAARTLRDPKERLATVLVTPFMNCGAKLPVFVVLIGAFFAQSQALMMFLMTMIAWILALTAARILRWTILRGEQTPFVMELPPYRMPTLKGLLIHTWERVWEYLKKAGTVILAVSVLIWAMMTFPGLPPALENVFALRVHQVENRLLQTEGPWKNRTDLEEVNRMFIDLVPGKAPVMGANDKEEVARAARLLESGEKVPENLASNAPAARVYLDYRREVSEIKSARSQARLRSSLAGQIGIAVEKITRPLGFDWRTNIALLGGVAAKEVIISSLGTAYSLGEEGAGEEPSSLSARLAKNSGLTPLTALVLMLFVMMYSPCSVTLAVMGREVGWRWSVFALVYTTAAAYAVCLAVALTGRVLGLGV